MLGCQKEKATNKNRGIADSDPYEYEFELVDVEYVKEAGTWYLRAYIDKPGGIAINDCEVVSRELSDLLDKRILSTTAISWK